MLPIVWRAKARANFSEIIRFIANDSPSAARRIADLIDACVLPAVEHPYLYRQGRVAGTREIIAHPNYIVVYQVTSTSIEVVSVLHARQEYPPE